jgi:NAD(P)-dependent dehydrogenase (short-subunit alcohol dehydrogenase family)
MTLHGARVVLLGGTAGIGLATARAAAGHGAEVIVASHGRSTVDTALAALPAGAGGRVLDVRDQAAVAAFFAGVGAFDHLVCTAGEPLLVGPLADTDLAAARAFFETRYWGTLTAVKYASPLLRPGGSITLTSGVTTVRPAPGWTVPTSTLGAVEALTRALAVELAPIRVNAVRPGLVRTGLWRDLPEPDREALYASFANTLPAGRAAEPDDIARTYVHLMEQDYTTGTIVTVDGGAVLV